MQYRLPSLRAQGCLSCCCRLQHWRTAGASQRPADSAIPSYQCAAGYRNHRRAICLGVVQACQEMNSAWPRCCDTRAKLAGVFCVGTCHEGGRFFVANEHESYLMSAASERIDKAVM